METVNLNKAKTHLSQLVEKAAKGDAFIIAKAGKPMVKVVPIDDPIAGLNTPRKLGFMRGMFSVPDDFDTMFREEIEEIFHGDEPAK